MSRGLGYHGAGKAPGRHQLGRRGKHKGNKARRKDRHGKRRQENTQMALSAPVQREKKLPGQLQVQLHGMTDDERQKVAKILGYRQIGKPVPKDVTLVDVIKTFPKEVYEIDHWRAWGALALTVSSMILGFTSIALAPWYLLPVAWFATGTAATGLFVLGHDCGHHVFHQKRWVNDIVGHVVLAPLIYPYEPWKIMHNIHHVHTNKLHKDTGWHPVLIENAGEGIPAAAQAVLGSPLKLWLSILHWVKLHFNPNNFKPSQMLRVQISWAICLGFAVSVWSALVACLGVAGWVKYWFCPWLAYHFWMSTFTLVHHTAPHIPFLREEQYHGAGAKLGGTVHCDFPRWVEILCHDINVHVPHHLSAKIPFYHLRTATDALRKKYGQYMTEGTFNWRMMRNFFTEIHLYDIGKEYVAFDYEKKENPLLAMQRRLLPDG